METAEPYALLAAGYEAVMAHVDYRAWASHVRRLLCKHHPEARDVLELGCGTGALARELQPLGPEPDGYRYRATDVSEAMLDAARRTAGRLPITFEPGDFRSVPAEPAVDVVLLLYDGLNYLLDASDVRRLLAGAAAALRPGGVFVFDQSTPSNSLRHAGGFDDAGATPAFDYVRTSHYDEEARLHRTTFRLRFPDGRQAREEHVQRAYSVDEIDALIDESPLTRVAAYHGLSLRPATPTSERVHWVARRVSG
jgi:SAM-dependent methyltransferase